MIAATHMNDVTELPVTDGTIALLNLQAQIDGPEPDVRLSHASVESRVGLIELITLRGLILGHIADYQRADEMAEQLVRDAATDGTAFVARARTRAVFHRFTFALDDIDRAERLGLNAETTSGDRAAIFQAVGRYDEALAIREEAADRRDSFENVAALVGLYAECGDSDAAERVYAESRRRYRGVSPFPLALLEFQLGLMWMNTDRLDEARASFEAARRRVPAYAAAQGHLAEVEAELGETESALARLYSLAVTSDDPDYAAQLARILGAAGRSHESRRWCRLAARRYDDLVARHPAAFADHAADFWLAAGANPAKALRLARMNVEVRKTPRAHGLLAQAIAANGVTGATSSARRNPDLAHERLLRRN